jgi:glycosyltransferase involved in cell wall biosynthesis
VADTCIASIVVPAYNEEAVIGRVLQSMLNGAMPRELDIVVVANGCRDRTADVARACGRDVTVIETELASKPAALNTGDAHARGYPRIYIDADIPIDVHTVRRLVEALNTPGALAATPTMRIEVAGRPWPVRAYYRVWTQLPYITDGQLAGVIALSEAGRARFGAFADVSSDDLWVRGHFDPEERQRLDDCEYVVQAPRTLRSLVHVKTRSYAGAIELGRRFPDIAVRARGRGGARGRVRALARKPRLWPALAVYTYVWGAARVRGWRAARTIHRSSWRRDETTRQ